MKNQRAKTEARNFRFSTVAAIVLMLAMLICGFTVMASAQDPRPQVGVSDLDLSGLQYDANSGEYYKTYDGTTDVTLSMKPDVDLGFAAGDDVTVKVNAAFNDKDVNDATYIEVSFVLEGADAGKYMAPKAFTLPAKICPKLLLWETFAEAKATYKPGVSAYTDLTVTLPTLKTDEIIGGDDVAVSATAPTVTVNGVTKADDYLVPEVQVALTGADKDNYTAPVAVKVTVEKIKIVSVDWAADGYTFVWGDEAANTIQVYGYDASNNPYELVIAYPEGYGNVNADGYLITAALPDSVNMEFDTANEANRQAKVVFTKKLFTVDMTDAIHVGDAGIQETPSKFYLAVDCDVLPAEIRALISYTSGGNAFAGTSDYGTHQIVATLPTSDNYAFVDAQGNAVTELRANLIINRPYIHAGSESADDYEIILVNNAGFSDAANVTVSIPESIAKKAIQGLRIHKAYSVTVSGVDGETYSILIPISDALLNKRAADLTADDLYFYEAATGERTKVSEKAGYTVSVQDGYYRVDGVTGNATFTFIIAPTYTAPFWLTAPGIALLVLLILALLVLMFLIGMYLRRIRNNEENPVLIVDEGEVPEVEPVVLEDTVDADAFLEETAENIAENANVEPESEENTEGVEEAVAESMQEMLDEAKEVVLDDTDPTEALVEEKVEELQDTPAEEEAEAEADEEALRDAVAAAMEENYNESADITDAVAVVEEEDSDEITPEEFRAVVDAIVSDAMSRTMDIPEKTVEEETEEPVVEESAEETPAEEAVAEEAPEDEAPAEEAPAEEAPAEETPAEEATEETLVVEEMSGEDVCAVVADSVAEAFELVTVDGVTPKAVEGTTLDTITEAVEVAADENVPETWTDDMTEAVKAAVVDELAARLLAEEAVEAFAVAEEPVESDEDDEEDDAEEEDTGFGGFGSMPLTFIDAIAEAEKYAEMCEQERNGEVYLVTRYRRSFQSRLAQSQGNVQDYYTMLKNALLSYKGVKNRISWNYEAFNRGRTHVAKINAKTKTLYLYLALDPEELKDTKYGIIDVSSKKKYASVPVLMKIKGERKFKYALELIAKLCGENLELPKLEIEEVDYRLPYKTTEELVQEGAIRKLVASVPVEPVQTEATAEEAETPTETVSAATEAQDVTFIAPTTVPAVEAAAQEVASEEAAAAEVPADAETSDDEPKQI